MTARETMAEWHRAIAATKKANAKKAAPRYPGGQIVHRHRKPQESEESILATALAQPHRRGAKSPRSALLGHAVGRLLATEVITGRQYQAAEHFTRVTIAHMRHVTGTVPRFPSMLASQLGAGGSAPEKDDDAIFDIRKSYGDLMGWIADTGELHDATRILTGVCIMDRNPHGVRELGTFRVALNSIARHLA